MVLSEQILNFFQALKIDTSLPKGVTVLNPYQNEETFKLCQKFYRKFYNDSNERQMVIGINPGRLGGGLTGIPFTDPIKLERVCGIANDLPKKAELSADFIHLVIDAFGGLSSFYSQFYFTSVSPLGFTANGKNLNYYDLPALQKALIPFILKCFQQQFEFGFSRKKAFVLGEGKNFEFLHELNKEHNLFHEVIALPHPRFIMQYKRKRLNEYINHYLKTLQTT